MAEDFGLKIGLEGEKEFKKALSDINQTFKVLGSEMKLVESQFGKNDTSIGSLTEKNKVLNKEIEAQKEKIATLRAALDNAASSFGENDRRTQNWQIQLNNAQAALNKMEQELEENNDALEEAVEEMRKAAEGAEDLGDEVEEAGEDSEEAGSKFEKLGSVVGSVATGITAAFAVVGAAAIAGAKALTDMSVGAAAYADNMLTASSVTGLSTDSLQAYSYAADLVDVSTETLTKSMAKQVKSMSSARDGSKAYAEAYQKLGVSVTDANGQLRDSETVYWECIDALGAIENETERDAVAMQLFGKSAQELNPLIAQGSDGIAALTEEARTMGAVLSEESLAKLGAFDDSIQRLSSGSEAAKNALGLVLLPQLQTLADGGVSLLGEFTSGLIAAEGDWTKISEVIGNTMKQAVQLLMDILPDIIDVAMQIVGAIGSAIVDNLPMLIEGASQIVFTILQGLIDALPQIAEGALQLVLTLVNGLIAALPQVLEVALQVIATLATGIANAVPTLIPTLVSLVAQLCLTLVQNLPMILDAALQLVLGLVQGILDAIPVLVAALPEVINAIVDFVITAIPQIIDAGIQLLTSLVTALPEIIASIVTAIPEIINNIISKLMEAIPQIIQAGIDLLISLVQALPQIITTIVAAIPEIISGILNAIIGNIDKIIMAGVQLFVALIENLPTIIIEICKAVPQIIEGLVSAIIACVPALADAGLNLIKGLWQGISDAGEWLWNKISGFFDGVVDKVKDFFGIASPSKLFAEFGGFMAEGLGEGFGDEMDTVGDDMTDATAKAGDATGKIALNSIKDGILNNIDMLDEPISEIVMRIGESLSEVLPQLMDLGSTADEALAEGIAEGGEATVLTEFLMLIEEIIAAFANVQSRFVYIGRMIMEGIGEGITSRSAWLNKLLRNYINEMKERVESMLGIHSPSKVFAEIGGYMAEGMGVGFERSMNDVRSQMEDSIPVAFNSKTSFPTADLVNGLVGGLTPAFAGGAARSVIVKVDLDGKTIAQTIFDPLKDVSKQRGVSLG